MPTSASTKPYEDDIDYLTAEMSWLETRCRRLIVERSLEAQTGHPEDSLYHVVRGEPAAILARYEVLTDREARLREKIDLRLSATREAGVHLGLDRLQREHRLDAFERRVLLLAVSSVVAPELEDLLQGACRSSSLSVGAILTFTELNRRERLLRLATFSESAPLVAGGLIRVAGHPDPHPDEQASGIVSICQGAFEQMTGERTGDTHDGEGQEPDPGSHMAHALVAEVANTDGQDQEGLPDSPDIPEERLTDIVLPPSVAATLKEIVDVARGGEPLLRRWGLDDRAAYGKGINVLLYGPPGTGKTLAARAIAGQLRRPLLDLKYADVASKWIGESSQHLVKAFRDAARDGAVLLLDEVDSLLTPRGEVYSHAHDDALCNTLLKELEGHCGIVVLATNLRSRLDSAVGRRLTYQIEFPLPGPDERVRLWEAMVPSTVPRDGDLDFDTLAARYELTGGLIRNAVRRACLRAARRGVWLTQAMLLEAAREEVIAQSGGQGSRPRVVGFSR
jgi:hypothetical protein